MRPGLKTSSPTSASSCPPPCSSATIACRPPWSPLKCCPLRVEPSCAAPTRAPSTKAPTDPDARGRLALAPRPLRQRAGAGLTKKAILIDQLFHALGDPTRRAIVDRLSAAPTTVTRLAEGLGITLTAVGQHLQILEITTCAAGGSATSAPAAFILRVSMHWSSGFAATDPHGNAAWPASKISSRKTRSSPPPSAANQSMQRWPLPPPPQSSPPPRAACPRLPAVLAALQPLPEPAQPVQPVPVRTAPTAPSHTARDTSPSPVRGTVA